ncbi:uncharacterized protein [Diadema antillarum]|uniref:uncharacterized protein n=1 Tax=Diadema antillarum TaxID=105358 RepID=UPI003A8A1FE0
MIALVERQQQGTQQPVVAAGTMATLSAGPSVEGYIAGIVVLVVAVVLVIALAFFFFRKWRASSKHYIEVSQNQAGNQLQETRKNIEDYKPGAYAMVVLKSLPEKALLAVYGVGGAGRSSFAKSLIYSVTDEYPSIETGTPEPDGQGVTTGSNFYRINGNISIQDTIDLPNSPNEVSEVVTRMMADKICCPIVVMGRNQDIQQYESTFRQFIKDIKQRLSFPPVFVVTRKNEGDAGDNRMKEQITGLGGVPDRIIFVDNILEETDDDDRKKIFLEVLRKLLRVADNNMVEKANRIFEAQTSQS